MPLVVPITEEMVRRLAPDESSWAKAAEIAASDRLQKIGVSSDGTWLLGDARGAGRLPYLVSADFIDPNQPVFRSTCPSRQNPDKYTLALLLKYARDPGSFGLREPSDELLARREKKVAAEERRKHGPAAPKREKKSAEEKQRLAQGEALEALDRLLVELACVGRWFEKDRLERVERTAKQLSDAPLPAAAHNVRRLLLLAKQKALSEDNRTILGAELLGQLHWIAQRTRAMLDGIIPEGETQEIADALAEDLVGRIWTLSELKERGYWSSNLHLLELAFERNDDDARQQRFEISNLLDLNSGDLVQAMVVRPYKGLTAVPEQPSYTAPIRVAEAAVHPGFLNRRVSWERNNESPGELTSEILESAYNLAVGDFAAVVEAFREQLQQPLAPREGVFLLQPERIGRIGERTTVLEDSAGVRLVAADRRKDYSHVANLVRAVGMLGADRPAILVRLYVEPLQNAVLALPLAALTPKHHLRLGI